MTLLNGASELADAGKNIMENLSGYAAFSSMLPHFTRRSTRRPRRVLATILLYRLSTRLQLIPEVILFRFPSWTVSFGLAEAEDRSRMSHGLRRSATVKGVVHESRERKERVEVNKTHTQLGGELTSPSTLAISHLFDPLIEQ